MEGLKKIMTKILRDWSKLGEPEFDGLWLGYNKLWNDINDVIGTGDHISMREVKNMMKELANESKVEFLPIWDSEGKLKGSGWFYCEMEAIL